MIDYTYLTFHNKTPPHCNLLCQKNANNDIPVYKDLKIFTFAII